MIVDYGGFVHPYRGNSYPSRPLAGSSYDKVCMRMHASALSMQ